MAGPGGAGSTRVVAVGSSFGSTSFAFTQTSGTFYLAEVARTGGVCSLYQSSAGASPSLDPTTAAQATSIPNDKLYVGTDGGGDNRTGDIAEILIYNALLNSTDQTTLENYLRNKYWGVSFGGSGKLVGPGGGLASGQTLAGRGGGLVG